MRKVIYYTSVIILILAIPLFTFGIINTMVSLKYETANDLTDCISLVSGQDLCLTIRIFQGLILACISGIVALLYFRKRILKR